MARRGRCFLRRFELPLGDLTLLRKGKKMRSRRLFGTGCINGVWMKIKILDDPARVIKSG